MIYLDTSVALAHLLAEDKHPGESLWRSPLTASRLLEFEVWTRLHARGLGRAHFEAAQSLVQRIAILELGPEVLKRALDPFPVPVRTLDTLHLASIEFLRGRGMTVELASYDDRMLATARKLGIPIASL